MMKLAMRNTLMLSLGIAAAAGSAAIAQDKMGKMDGGKMGGKMMVSPQDKTFMMKAEQSNLAEIKTSQLALQKATKPDLKTFAQKMIDDHTKAEEELKQLAGSKGVKLSGDPGEKNKEALAKLKTLNGAAFDSSYTKIQKDGHDLTILVFQQELISGKDTGVKAYARKYLPAIKNHDNMIKGMKMGGKPMAVSGKMASPKSIGNPIK